MGTSGLLVAALKRALKARGVTYAHVAQSLQVSEASVKRMFSRGDFTLKRLDRILDLAGFELADLLQDGSSGERLLARLSVEQERALVSDRKLMLVALCAINHWPLEKIVETYALSEPECIRLLARLDRLGVIRLLPGNRVRPLLSRGFAWLPDGPVQQYFKAQAQQDYFRSRFDGPDELLVFVTARLSRRSREAMLARLRRVAAEFAERHNEELRLPFRERLGMSLLLAMRPWELSAFRELRRRK